MFNFKTPTLARFLAFVLLLTMLAGCATQFDGLDAPRMHDMETMVESESDDGYYKSVASNSTQDIAVEVQEQLIIRNADLAIIVKDTAEALDAIRAQVNALGGWEVNSNIYAYNEVKRGSIQVRVPADQLDPFLNYVQGLANEVTHESSSGQDVTEEYVDLQAQLGNLEATRDRVRTFLEDADEVDDALAVNQELSQLEGEIARITGRMKYLQSAARYSLVSIDITPDELAQPVTIGKWHPEGTARDAIEALISTLQWLIDALIVVVLFVLPVALILGAPLFFLIRFLRKRSRRRRSAKETKKTKEPSE